MGLLSDGQVHSHILHIEAIAEILSKEGIEVLLHAFMDGRDTAPMAGELYLQQLKKNTSVKIASMMGRSIAMDRDRRFEKNKRGL